MGKKSDTQYYVIVIMLLSLALGTALHDPFLHGIVAHINGWTVESYSSNLFTGQTSTMAPVNAPTNQVWVFYMFPAMFIIVAIFIVTYLALMTSTMDDKFILVIGIVLVALNIPSLYPGITGSDSESAMRILIDRGMPDFSAVIIHYTIFLIFFVLWSMYLFIAVENNPKDAKKRLNSLIK